MKTPAQTDVRTKKTLLLSVSWLLRRAERRADALVSSPSVNDSTQTTTATFKPLSRQCQTHVGFDWCGGSSDTGEASLCTEVTENTPASSKMQETDRQKRANEREQDERPATGPTQHHKADDIVYSIFHLLPPSQVNLPPPLIL